MVRIQLHLTDEQAKRLNALARRQHTTRAELIRAAIDRYLAEPGDQGDALLELVGLAGPGGPASGSEDHDDTLYGRIEAEPVPPAAEPRRK